MNKIVEKELFSENVCKFVVEAPEISISRKPGNFVIIRLDEKGERIPLTIASSDPEKGTITLVVQRVGVTTAKMLAMNVGDVIRDVADAIETMDAKMLAGYFNSTIDLEIGETDGNYSKTQAEMIVRDFFKNSPLKSFTVNHQGSSNDGSKYFIGTYETSSQVYRVYVLLKKQGEQLLIHQLQFEKE
jgi:hypothetical protein